MSLPKSTLSAGNAGGDDLRRLQAAVLHEPLEADQQGISRERRERRVGGVAVAGRADGQHLPQRQAGVGEEIHEPVRGAPEVADAVRSGQRRGMEEDAARPVEPLRHVDLRSAL